MMVLISSVFHFFFFISNLKDVGSNPDTVNLNNSVYTQQKKNPTPLTYYNYLTKINHLYSLKKSNLQKYYLPIPFSLLFKCARSMPQPRKNSPQTKTWLVYLYLVLVYTLTTRPQHLLFLDLRLLIGSAEAPDLSRSDPKNTDKKNHLKKFTIGVI